MHLRKNCTRAVRTEELARELKVHKSHLVRVFSNAMGMAPQMYMRQVRVAKARELISGGSQLSEVAHMLDRVPPGALSRDVGGHRRKQGGSAHAVPASHQAAH
jgi:AraC-like DNA-binding protein